MARTLVTGMSATGKSTTTARLAQQGLRAVDLDTEEWSHWVPDDSPFATGGEAKDWRWRLDDVRALLEGEPDVVVSGTSTNQGEVYDLLDHVVVLTTPLKVARYRLETRETNDFGKDPAELQRELELRAVVEPILLDGACLVVDTSERGPGETADAVAAHHSHPCGRRQRADD